MATYMISGEQAITNPYFLCSDTLFEVKDDLGAVRRELSVQQTIRESQSTIIAQQTTVTQTVQDTMTHITNETRNIHNETQSMHETVRAAMDGSRAERDQVIHMLNRLLEQVSGLSLSQDPGTRVVEEVDDSGRLVGEVPDEEILPNDKLVDCVNSILGAIRDKEGIFGLEEAKDLADALIFLLETVASNQSINTTSTYGHWRETCTKQDLTDLRRNLVAVQGIIMSTRSISVNKSSRCQARNEALMY